MNFMNTFLFYINIIDEFFTGISRKATLSEIKAFINAYLIPASLFVIDYNLMYPFLWLCFATAMYLFNKPDSENAKNYFALIKIFTIVVLYVCLIILIFSMG